jgi:hypothetical protein
MLRNGAGQCARHPRVCKYCASNDTRQMQRTQECRKNGGQFGFCISYQIGAPQTTRMREK